MGQSTSQKLYTHSYLVHQYNPVPELPGFVAPTTLTVKVTNSNEDGASVVSIMADLLEQDKEDDFDTIGKVFKFQLYGGKMRQIHQLEIVRSGMWLYLEDP